MEDRSGIGVLDKVVDILDLLSSGAASLPEVVRATRMPKPTAHRLLQGLAHHGVVQRDSEGRYIVGPLVSVWATAGSTDTLLERARPVLDKLRDTTGLSAQLYVLSGAHRLCIAAAEPASGLRDTVPVGSLLTLHAGSAAQVLVAWADPEVTAQALIGAAYNAATLLEVRKRGWAQSAGEREPGVASVSSPVLDGGRLVAAVSVSGPVEKMGKRPGVTYGDIVIAAGRSLSS